MNAILLAPACRPAVTAAPNSTRPTSTLERGNRPYRRASLALFLAGFSSFSLLYCVQPLLPEFTRDFGVDPASSALALSLSTGALAFAIFAAGALSQALPRRGLMFWSMALAAVFNIIAGLAPSWPLLLGARLLEGLALGGVPAVAMTYLSEEIHPRDLGKAMGLYVAGTAFGGMMGRVGMGLMTEMGSWRSAMVALALIDVAAALGFAALLPASRNFTAQRGVTLYHHVRTWTGHLRHSGLGRLFAIGFLVMSVFVTLFNYAGFRLSEQPYGLGQTALSAVFLTYIAGLFVSPVAGHLADRFGRRVPLACGCLLMAAGTAVTLAGPLPWIVTGILMVTVGFFTAHSIASGWVGRLAVVGKGHASSLYLLAYYLGSSVTGTLGGWFWQHSGWIGVVALTGLLAVAAGFLSLSIREETQ